MAATPFNLLVTASQVGTYFMGQYYKVLQQQPDYLHHFYTPSSTMLRFDGTTRLTATTLPQIQALVMSLNYTGFEIQTAHSLESWNHGVLVMVSGLVRSRDFRGKRKFMDTFFLAPQDNGYFVLNNIFHMIDDEPLHNQSVPYMSQTDEGYLPKAPATVQKQASDYVVGGDGVWQCVFPTTEENGPDEKYTYSEQQLRQIFEAKAILENNYTQPNGSFLDSRQHLPTQLSPRAEESMGPQKHTYASIVAKVQSATPPPRQPPVKMSTPSATEHFGNDAPTMEGEIKSVYVRNLPTTVTPFEIEEAFKKFGRLKPYEGVFIRSQEDVGVCYAFVEFEDVTGVKNAIKASKIEIAGRQVFIEERRPDIVGAYRGRGRGKGKGKGKGRGKGRHSTEVYGGYFGGQGHGRGNSYYRAVSH